MTGTITSPRFTIKYQEYLDCTWIIEPPNTDFVSIIFSDLHLTDLGQAEENPDSVNVYDGDSIGSPLLANLTASQSLPIQIVSTGNKIMIHFTTNSIDTLVVGLSLEWKGMQGNWDCGFNHLKLCNH